MNKLICSVGISALALATTALGDKNHGNGESVAAPVHRGASSVRSAAPAMSNHVTSAPRVQRSFATAPVRQRTYASTPRVRSNTVVRSSAAVRSAANTRVRSNLNRTTRSNVASARVRTDANVRANRNVTANRERNFARNRHVNVGANFAVNRNRTRNAVVTNNWRGSQFAGRNYAAFRNYNRQWHNRGWWRSHFNTIVFVGGGWWYWDNDYWYPAWGYDTSAYYPYDGPIYGYSNAGPGQVVVNVQSQLARDGYYSGPIDGVLGPMTRQAIAAYQADNGLAVTSTVDEPTVASLGLS
jgi:Putative peptidoglycan binding domain